MIVACGHLKAGESASEMARSHNFATRTSCIKPLKLPEISQLAFLRVRDPRESKAKAPMSFLTSLGSHTPQEFGYAGQPVWDGTTHKCEYQRGGSHWGLATILTEPNLHPVFDPQ